jgi:hypothetical protein
MKTIAFDPWWGATQEPEIAVRGISAESAVLSNIASPQNSSLSTLLVRRFEVHDSISIKWNLSRSICLINHSGEYRNALG